MDASHDDLAPGRRRFIALVGLAGVSSALRVPAALAQAATPATPPATPAAPAPAAPEISEDAKALAGIVKRRYGQHLSEDELKSVTEELEFRVQNGKRLRGATLANGDEPDATFHA